MRYVAVSFTALYLAWGKPKEASEWAGRAIRLHLEVLDHKLPLLSECEQCQLLRAEKGSDDWMDVMQVGWRKGAGQAGIRAAAECVLNCKGIALELMTDRARLARDAADPAALDRLDQLGRLRGRIAAARRAGTLDSDAGRALLDEEVALSKALGRLIYKDGRSTEWARLEDVRAKLPPDGVFVEVLRVKDRELITRKPLGEKYIAWVVPPKGDITLVELGRAERIDAAVRNARQALAETDARLRRGDRLADLEAEAREALGKVGGLVLRPLWPHLKGARRWLVSPDAALWLFPWNAFPVEEKGYVAERHVIQHLVTARDLIRKRPAQATGRAVVMGYPDFDLEPEKGRAPTATDRRRAGRGERSRSGDLGDDPFGPLPGTRAEVEGIIPLIRKYTGRPVIALTGADASEGTFRKVTRPRILVLCTHGVFLKAPPGLDEGPLGAVPEGRAELVIHAPPGARVWVDGVETPSRIIRTAVKAGGSVSTDIRVRLPAGEEHKRRVTLMAGKRKVEVFGPPLLPSHLENPLLRCGLILAGANKRHLLPPQVSEDGVLTGLEIVGADLRGTELVVLSACETGVGDPRDAEGVVGLRQAFQLAGTAQVVASLWKVPDAETKDLMVAFWSGLRADGDPAAALAGAQETLIRRWRSAGKPTHPVFWAGFGVTGAAR